VVLPTDGLTIKCNVQSVKCKWLNMALNSNG